MRLLSFGRSQVSDKAGLPPGTLAYIGEPHKEAPGVGIFRYNENHIEETSPAQSKDWQTLPLSHTVSWINVDGVHDVELIKQIGEVYHLHPLILEDIVNTTQRPRLEEYDNGIYLVIRMFSYDGETEEIDSEQISIFLGKGFVLTFQEKSEDVFGPIRKRLKQSLGRVRKKGADYLFYALLDVIISNYFVVVEGIEDQVEVLEERLHEKTSPGIIKEIQHLKKNLIFLRKSIMPLRDVMTQLNRIQDAPLIDHHTFVFLRDTQGQLIQILELIETYREVLSGLYDLHFAMNGQRLNEVMKVLTVVSTIFIPLTFIAGIYGMNFQHMPELAWQNGYFMAWGLMGIIGIVLLIIFRRKSWI